MQPLWSVKRASGVGVTTALLALLLWPFIGLLDPLLAWLFMAMAAVSGLCGFTILAMTIRDIATRPRRGVRIRPIRSFDTILALILLALSWFELHDMIRLFPV
jgi:hypothetical protein